MTTTAAPGMESTALRPAMDLRVWVRLRRDGLALAGVTLFGAIAVMAVFGPMVLSGDPRHADPANAFLPPGRLYPLGTDELGRDVWTRLVFGARASLLNGFEALLVGLAIGVPVGLAAGYLGGLWDDVLMGSIEILMAVPGILLAILAVATLGPGQSHIALAVGLVSGPLFARVVRGTTLALREQEFVVAARAVGAPEMRVLIRHILPGCVSPLAVMSVLRLGTTIVTVAGLGFLGLGGDPSIPEWGAMLSQGQQFLRRDPLLALIPGMAILLTVMSVNLLGDALTDALNPRLGSG